MDNAFVDGDALEFKLGMKKSSIERIIGIPQRSLSDEKFLELPETQVLLKIIYTMPWILEVFENHFDPEACQLILAKQYFELKLQERKEKREENGKADTK